MPKSLLRICNDEKLWEIVHFFTISKNINFTIGLLVEGIINNVILCVQIFQFLVSIPNF